MPRQAQAEAVAWNSRRAAAKLALPSKKVGAIGVVISVRVALREGAIAWISEAGPPQCKVEFVHIAV